MMDSTQLVDVLRPVPVRVHFGLEIMTTLPRRNSKYTTSRFRAHPYEIAGAATGSIPNSDIPRYTVHARRSSGYRLHRGPKG